MTDQITTVEGLEARPVGSVVAQFHEALPVNAATRAAAGWFIDDGNRARSSEETFEYMDLNEDGYEIRDVFRPDRLVGVSEDEDLARLRREAEVAADAIHRHSFGAPIEDLRYSLERISDYVVALQSRPPVTVDAEQVEALAEELWEQERARLVARGGIAPSMWRNASATSRAAAIVLAHKCIAALGLTVKGRDN